MPRPRRFTTRLTTLALAAALTAPALAVDSKDNAALRYWQAWATLDQPALDALAEVTLDNLADPAFTLTDALTALVAPAEGSAAASSTTIDLLIKAAALPEADFAIDHSMGPEALIPHLSPMRRSATLLLVDARRLFALHNADAAVDRLIAAYRTSHHAIGDATAISSLVSFVIFKSAQSVTDYALNAGLLTADHRAKLAEAIALFDTDNPFGLGDIVRIEREVMSGWMRTKLATEGPRAFVSIMNRAMYPSDPSTLERLHALLDAQDPTAAINAQIDLYESLMQSMEAAWGDAAKVADVEAKIARMCEADNAPVACILMPALSKLHDRSIEGASMITALRDQLAP